ncbi:MAG: hypothetical protein HY644_09310 [Acidobacteria bacterium]|nr:hypothetical protein [Acidobacteriota bacterium]
MMKIRGFPVRLSQLSPITVTAIGLLLALGIGLVDVTTGAELSFSIFYLIPVCLVVWLAGKKPGVFMSSVAAAIWLWADIVGGTLYTSALFPYWNALVRLGFFLIVTYLLLAFKDAQEREKLAVAQEQRRMLLLLMDEIYNPLTAILGNVSLLKDEDLSPAARLCLGEIQQAAQKIDSVLVNLKKLRLANLGSSDQPN